MTRLLIPALVALLVSGPVLADINHRSACLRVDGTISELIKLAPKGTGWVNRTRFWFENWAGIFSDLFLGGGELSEVGHAVIGIDFNHSVIYVDSMQIMNVEGEFVEEAMPSKLAPPAVYITKLNAFKELLLEPECNRYKSG